MEKNLWKGRELAPALWNSVERVRIASPLVHNITNFVVMNNTANAVLAVGASPIMSHAHSEVEVMVGICGSVVINIGTLDEYWAQTMVRAAREANRVGKPWLLDPVGAGATPYRDEVSAQLLALRPTVIRGNASEIMAVATATAKLATRNLQNSIPTTKGVDSTASSDEATGAASFLNREFGSVVCISGETDIIVGGSQGDNEKGESRIVCVHNGSTMMTRVTGLGCSASAVIGAFIACVRSEAEVALSAKSELSVSTARTLFGLNRPYGTRGERLGDNARSYTDDIFDAVVAATALFAIAGEIAAEQVQGPGSLQVALLDKLYNITEEEFAARLKLEVRSDVA